MFFKEEKADKKSEKVRKSFTIKIVYDRIKR